jgi:quercetin dioxygenase-like cupin family protein
MKVISEKSVPEYQAPLPSRRTAKILIDEYSAGTKNLAMGIANYPPGEKAEMHTHEGEEVMYFLEGEGLLETPEGKFPVRKGDSLIAYAKEPHSVENRGDRDMVFLFVFCPPGTEKSIRSNWKSTPGRSR